MTVYKIYFRWSFHIYSRFLCGNHLGELEILQNLEYVKENKRI